MIQTIYLNHKISLIKYIAVTSNYFNITDTTEVCLSFQPILTKQMKLERSLEEKIFERLRDI